MRALKTTPYIYTTSGSVTTTSYNINATTPNTTGVWEELDELFKHKEDGR